MGHSMSKNEFYTVARLAKLFGEHPDTTRRRIRVRKVRPDFTYGRQGFFHRSRLDEVSPGPPGWWRPR